MKIFSRITGTLVCLILSVGYILCCLTPYIPSTSWRRFSLLALFFPYAFGLMVIAFIFFMLRNRRLAILLLCVIPFGYKNISTTFAVHIFSSWSDKKPEKSLRILTWNVQGFANLNGKKSEAEPGWWLVLQHIKEWQPDVACLQEYRTVFGHKKMVDMKDRMDSAGYKYFYCPPDFVFDTYSGVHIMQGVAIFSKYPLVETGSVKILDESGFVEKMAYADLEFDHKTIRFFSAHLASYQLYSQEIYEDHKTYQATMENKRSIMSKIQQREILHEQQVKIIRNAIAQSPHPVIYCGDLNNTPASYTYHYLRGNLQDVWLKDGIGLGKTFYNLAPSLRIDVCLADTAFRIRQSTVKRVYASDHFPVLSDVSWK